MSESYIYASTSYANLTAAVAAFLQDYYADDVIPADHDESYEQVIDDGYDLDILIVISGQYDDLGYPLTVEGGDIVDVFEDAHAKALEELCKDLSLDEYTSSLSLDEYTNSPHAEDMDELLAAIDDIPLRSWAPKMIIDAMHRGEDLWHLETGQDDVDDTLIGPLGGIAVDVIAHVDPEPVPEYWYLTKLHYCEDDAAFLKSPKEYRPWR